MRPQSNEQIHRAALLYIVQRLDAMRLLFASAGGVACVGALLMFFNQTPNREVPVLVCAALAVIGNIGYWLIPSTDEAKELIKTLGGKE